MVTIPKEVQDFLPGKLAWVATASQAGEPNVTPKGTLKLLDEQHVTFTDLFSRKTRQNLRENPRVAVTVADPSSGKGYQLKGRAEQIESGQLFQDLSKELRESHALTS
jgi:predicted pyridoxine 5'-phosphate oxidase superfamily flavin-nucleotide-binding protein